MTPDAEPRRTRDAAPEQVADAAFAHAYDALLDRWRVPVTPVRIESPYGTTHVNACGPADGEPLVLLHGGAATAADWFANAAELGRTRRVYAVDRIGEPGRSAPGHRPIRTRADLFNWFDGVLDGLGLDSAAVCGHSYGAWIALNHALHAPHRVDRLILLDPTQCFANFRPVYLWHALPLLLRKASAQRRLDFVDWETQGTADDPTWRRLAGLAAEFPHGKIVTGGRPKAARLAALRTPTLAVFAERSRVHDAAKVAVKARTAIPGIEVVTLPGVSHHGMPFVEAPALNRTITDFLDRTADVRP